MFVLIIVLVFLCFYLYFQFRNRSPDFPPRFLRTLQNSQTSHRSCLSDAECHDRNELCYRGACHPRLRRGDECDPATGEWTLTELNGQKWVACVCRYPDLVGQSHPGGNCDVDRVCGPIGHLKKTSTHWECECPADYVSTRNPLDGKPHCAKMTVAEREFKGPCRDDELDLLNPVDARYLKSSYTARFPNIRCVKTPCSFDALTNKPLDHVLYIRNLGCVCNPRRGNVGVHIENHPDYIDVLGYNACVNIFERGEPSHDWSDVTLYTYYYLYDKKPMSFITFSNLPPDAVAEPFREALLASKSLQIEENWPYDYTQHVLRNQDQYVVRVPIPSYCGIPHVSIHNPDKCRENYNVDFEIEKCKDIFQRFRKNPNAVFFQYPVCRVEPGDLKSTDVYDRKVISNPLHITSNDLISQRLKDSLSNGIQLKPYDSNRWSVDFAPTHSDYMRTAEETLIPNYDTIFRNV